jgi:predicted amidohydrolase
VHDAAAFREFVVQAKEKPRGGVPLAYLVGRHGGHFYPKLYRPDCIDVDATVKVGEREPRHRQGLQGARRARRLRALGHRVDPASRPRSGSRRIFPVYIHFGQLWDLPESGANGVDPDKILEQVVPLLKPGDILAHPFTRHPGGFVNRDGRVHPIVKEALARGLKTDVGHGSHFSYRMARIALEAGIVPDTLGADMHGYNTRVPAPRGTPSEHPDKEHMFFGQTRFSLVSAMSSMLALGLPLEAIVPMVTTHPAKMLGMQGEVGNLKPGVAADVSVLHDERGRWTCATTKATRCAPSACCGRISACARARATTRTPRSCRRSRKRRDRGRASARGFRARKTGAFCSAKASTSPTSGFPERSRSPSCALPWRMQGSWESPSRPAGEPGLHRSGSGQRQADPRRLGPERLQARRSSRFSRATRCARSASWWRCASRRRGPEAEDLADLTELNLEELPAVVDMIEARTNPPALVHEEWEDNVFLESLVDDDLSSIQKEAKVKIRRQIRTARQHMSPMEGRGVVCEWNRRLGQLVMYSAAQMPHINRAGLAECLGIDQGAIRVVAPDVGGGFGYKGILLPEEVALAWLCRRLGRPVRWIEDRREQLSANANCREHHYDLTLYADARGKILGIDCEATVDSGAYSSYPFSACLEAAQVSSILPRPLQDGPLPLPHLVGGDEQGADPALSRRGAHRRVLRARADDRRRRARARHRAARDAPREPRTALRDAVQQHHEEALRQRRLSGGGAARGRHDRSHQNTRATKADPGKTPSRRIGVGFSIYCEQAAHAPSVYYGWGIPMVPGHEQWPRHASRPTRASSFASCAHSHGQGMETTLAQVAHTIHWNRPDSVRLIHGDTALTPSPPAPGLAQHGDVGRRGSAACDAMQIALRQIRLEASWRFHPRISRSTQVLSTVARHGPQDVARRSGARLVPQAAASPA